MGKRKKTESKNIELEYALKHAKNRGITRAEYERFTRILQDAIVDRPLVSKKDKTPFVSINEPPPSPLSLSGSIRTRPPRTPVGTFTPGRPSLSLYPYPQEQLPGKNS